LIEEVEDRDGGVVYRSDTRECTGCEAAFTGDDGPDIAYGGQQLIDPITAYQIDTMLEGVVQRGTAVQASSLGRPIGGKTGTTNDFRSAWFMGFSPQIVVGVFVGFDDNRSLGKGETGAVAALPIFIEFMQEALKGMPVMDFKAPPGTKFANVGPNREAFRPGTEPGAQALPVSAPGVGAKPFAITPITPTHAPPISPAPPAIALPAATPVKSPKVPPKTPDETGGLY
ncbi:MAG TPA: penicillin-binding transpeptidase domain-containing protein, partial [Caulobacteraceae bacterium]